MSRNKNRLGESSRAQSSDAPTQFNPLNFVAPTEFVDLPSAGKGYPEGHPLCDLDTIEIRYMTAKDEDILTSQTLLKKGLAVERFMQNIIVDKNIDPISLLVGDRNAILIAARISGYGADYEGVVTCGNCGTQNRLMFDLNASKIKHPELNEKLNVTRNSSGTYNVKLPFSKFTTEIRLMTGEDETYLSQHMASLRKNKLPENLLTTQFKRMIVSVEGHTEKEVLNTFIDNMPTADSRHLRLTHRKITPDIEIRETMNCKECDNSEEVDVPFGTDFFWPDR